MTPFFTPESPADAIPACSARLKPLDPVYGRLVVLYRDGQMVMCACSCGSPPRFFRSTDLRRGVSSCGCVALAKFQASNAAKTEAVNPEYTSISGSGVRAKYLHHMAQAERRGIPWQFTFDSWCRVWHESGRWADRGRGIGRYAMARFGDVGPYAPSNVEIITHSQNSRDSIKNKPRPKQPIPPALGTGRGWTFDSECRRPYRVRCAGKNLGGFLTQQEAEAAYQAAAAERVAELRCAV